MESNLENKNNQLNLRWNGFTDNILSSLESSLGSQDFVDVTLVCERGGSVKAHRLILSASSSFFHRVLKENDCPHPVIVLKGIDFSDLETLLMFMYHGEARVSEENIPRLLEAAAFLEVTGLSPSDYSQASSEPKIVRESDEMISKIENGFLHSGVLSTTQEFNDFPQVNTLNSYGISPQRDDGTEFHEVDNEKVDVKTEPSEEEEIISVDLKEINNRPYKKGLVSKTILKNKSSSCSQKVSFSAQEMQELQQQKRLAFYEPRPCPRCRRVYRDAATLRNHIASMHQPLRHKIPCCGSVFPTKHDFHEHRRQDHNHHLNNNHT